METKNRIQKTAHLGLSFLALATLGIFATGCGKTVKSDRATPYQASSFNGYYENSNQNGGSTGGTGGNPTAPTNGNCPTGKVQFTGGGIVTCAQTVKVGNQYVVQFDQHPNTEVCFFPLIAYNGALYYSCPSSSVCTVPHNKCGAVDSNNQFPLEIDALLGSNPALPQGTASVDLLRGSDWTNYKNCAENSGPCTMPFTRLSIN